MIKKLVYFLYIDSARSVRERVESDETLRLHFKLLRHYAKIFDEATFVLSVNKDVLGRDDVIRDYIMWITSIGYLNVRFKVEENTCFRECKAFKEEVVESLDNENKLVFFGHSKGTTNEHNVSVLKLITSMYYYGLNFIDEVEKMLIGDERVYYGFPLLNAQWSEPSGNEVMPKYKYYFYGTFFWTNVSLLREIMRNKNREYPKCVSRFYAENFPANTIETDLTSSHKDVWMPSGMNLHYNFEPFFEDYREYFNEGNDFEEFYEMIMNKEI